MAVTSYAEFGEDLVAAYLLGKKKEVVYIDVGCLWPRRQSISYFFYERGGQGLCIDANPTVASQWADLRPRDTFKNIGIGSKPGILTYHMYENPVFNTFSDERAAHVQAQSKSRPGRELLETVEVPVITLEAATRGWDLASASEVDFMSLDVEGYELDVIHGWDATSLRPRLVACEHIRRRRARTRLETLPLVEEMESRGYWLAAYTGHDLYFLDEGD